MYWFSLWPALRLSSRTASSVRGGAGTEEVHDQFSESGVCRIEESGSGHSVSSIFDVLPVEHLAIDAYH